MAVLDHHHLPVASDHECNRGALHFCLIWVAFFALLGLFTYTVSAL
jgi:hypothetical protein